jgi:hypothetical protein
MDKFKLEQIVKESKTKTECLKKMGLRAAGGNYRTITKYIEKYQIDINHFDAQKVRIEKINQFNSNRKIPLSEILIEKSTYHRQKLKERLYNENIKQRECELCGQNEIWNGKRMSLIIDHINGVWDDNRIENLRIVCPNCNATLPTHCGKNKSNYPKEEKIDGRTMITEVKRKFYENTRKTHRPDYNTLKNEIELLGYVKTGKKYGVSDNAIRKWVKFYEKFTQV